MARHLVKRQAAASKGKQLAAKGMNRNKKQAQQVADERAAEEVELENEVAEVDNGENKGGRSPRRAALEAAKKIYCTARNYGPKKDDGGECSYRPRNPTPKSPAAPKKKIQIIYDLQEAEPELNLEEDLLLECEDDVLSEAQTKVLKRQQQAYNLATRKIKDANLANERFLQAQLEFFKHK